MWLNSKSYTYILNIQHTQYSDDTYTMNNPAGSKYKYIQNVNSYASDKVYMTCHILYRTQMEGVGWVT